MISLNKHTSFEQTYFKRVYDKFDKGMDIEKIINDSKNYLPFDFYDVNSSHHDKFEQLILADFSKIDGAIKHIESNRNTQCTYNNLVFRKNGKKRAIYKRIFECYDVLGSVKNKTKLSVELIKSLDITVCPYCNRDYINSRGNKISGAQIDHFFPRSEYPIFSVSLYNLVPVCGNCNRVKSNKIGVFKSPFDTKFKWNDEIKFKYDVTTQKISINYDDNLVQNISKMQINEAYEIHDIYANNLFNKRQKYNDTQIQEMVSVLSSLNFIEADIKKLIFGEEIKENDLRNTSLGKLTMDLQKLFKIYD